MVVTADTSDKRCRGTRDLKEELGLFYYFILFFFILLSVFVFFLFFVIFFLSQSMETTFWKEVEDKWDFTNAGLLCSREYGK